MDVVAVGMVDGRISLHNFRVDETITTFHHNVNTPSNDPSPLLANGVVSITFRTDGVENMLTADSLGNICVWDLPSRSLVSSLRGVHNEIHFALFLPSEPVFITAGVDNALKIHLFDHGSSEPRLLRARQGHHLPPTLIRFAGEDGLHMVSAGLDHELRLVSAVHDARNRPFRPPTQLSAPQRKRLRIQENKEVGERAVSNRLPLVHALACNTARNRDGDFANVVTLHEGLQQAYTWRLQDGASHHHVLTPPPHPEMFELTFKKSKSVGKKRKKEKVVNVDSTATSVVLTPCGNYAIVGSQDGRIHSYNLQSGRHKGVYQLENSLTENSWGYAHHGPVVALSVDSCGDTLVSAGAEDCTLKFWNLHDRHESGDCIVTSSNIRNLSWCSTSDLIVIACQDFCLYVYDGSTRKLARHFKGHCGPIVDVCFDHQGRRVLSASMDSTVRTWDLPSGRLVDTMACADAPTSISVAPGGDYIATTHVNDLGVNLWVDRSKFLPLSSVSIEYSSSAVSEGSVVVDDAPLDEEVKKCTENVVDVADDEFGRPKPLSRDVVTLSCHPTSHWTVLSDLQAIKERNKPKEPVEKPQSAPFFLPTVKGLKMEFDTSGILREASGKKSAKACSDKEGKENGDVNEEDWANSRFGKLVAREEYDSAAQLLRNLEPSGVDLEIRTLEGQMTRRKACVFFEKMLQCPQDFELTQAHLSVFLKSQGIALAKDDEGSRLLNALLESQAAAWESLRSNFESVVSLSGYFSGQV